MWPLMINELMRLLPYLYRDSQAMMYTHREDAQSSNRRSNSGTSKYTQVQPPRFYGMVLMCSIKFIQVQFYSILYHLIPTNTFPAHYPSGCGVALEQGVSKELVSSHGSMVAKCYSLLPRTFAAACGMLRHDGCAWDPHGSLISILGLW